MYFFYSGYIDTESTDGSKFSSTNFDITTKDTKDQEETQNNLSNKTSSLLESILYELEKISQSIDALEQKFDELLKRYQQLNVRIRFVYRSLVNLVKNLAGKQANKKKFLDKFLQQLVTLQINAENLLNQLQGLRGMLGQINTQIASISKELDEEDLEYVRLQLSIIANKLNRLEQLIRDFISRLVKKSNNDVLSIGKKLTTLRKIKRSIFLARIIIPLLPIILVVLLVCCLIFVGIIIIQKLYETFPPFLVDSIVQNAKNLF